MTSSFATSFTVAITRSSIPGDGFFSAASHLIEHPMLGI